MERQPVLWISIFFSDANPDPTFNFDADPDPMFDPDPDPK
jgi:hypothetical protein